MHTMHVACVWHISALGKQQFIALCHVPKVTDRAHGRAKMTPGPTSCAFTVVAWEWENHPLLLPHHLVKRTGRTGRKVKTRKGNP